MLPYPISSTSPRSQEDNGVQTTCPGFAAAASVVASLSWGRAVLSHSSREQDSLVTSAGPISRQLTTLLHRTQVNYVIVL